MWLVKNVRIKGEFHTTECLTQKQHKVETSCSRSKPAVTRFTVAVKVKWVITQTSHLPQKFGESPANQ